MFATRLSAVVNWYPYVNSYLCPDACGASLQAVGVFCENRKGFIA
jgi:hypothetical protein